MATTGILAVCATACAGLGGFSLVRAWCARGERRRGAAIALQRDDRFARIARVLQYGCPPLIPVARRSLELPAVRQATAAVVNLLTRRSTRKAPDESVGPALEETAVLSCMLAAALFVSVIGSVAMGSIVGGVACALGLELGLIAHARTAEEKHNEAVREEVPEALRSMGVCFRSGLSLLQTLRQVAHELDGSLGRLFGTAARRLEMGATTTEALAVFDTARQVPELTFVAVALDAQHQSGGSIAAVLESARESVESELELRRSLRVQTAQAKLSARIVTLMPFILVALFSFMSPGFLDPFFTSVPGMALLGLALGMQLAGTLVVHRMLRSHAD